MIVGSLADDGFRHTFNWAHSERTDVAIGLICFGCCRLWIAAVAVVLCHVRVDAVRRFLHQFPLFCSILTTEGHSEVWS
jgi:hypothetical protein